MKVDHAVPPGVHTREGWTPLRRTMTASDVTGADGEMPLRTGVERGMVAALSVAGPLLVMLSLPAFEADRLVGSSPLPVASLILAAVLVGAVPLALVRFGTPAYTWVRVAMAAYVGLIAVEPFQIRTSLPSDTMPWLISVSGIAFSCVVIATLHPLRAVGGCLAIVVALTVVYGGRISQQSLILEAIGLTALGIGMVAGVASVRIRADAADSAQRRAAVSFQASRRQEALEAERVRTDALLHDSVLATLSTAAAEYGAPSQTLLMARTALDILTDTADSRGTGDMTETFEQAVAAAEREFAPMRGLIQLDLSAAAALELPAGVAEALVSAMLQALSNSIKHAAGPAVRSATATTAPDGGVRICISDDGPGFDMDEVAPERLGVRVSILERMQLIGATAVIQSAPGRGTTVLLEWRPAVDASTTMVPAAAPA